MSTTNDHANPTETTRPTNGAPPPGPPTASRARPYGPLLVVMSLVVLGVAVWLIVEKSQMPEATVEPPAKYWVYNMQSGALSVTGTEKYPPIAFESGETGYWATVYSCTSCGDEASRKVAFLTRFSPEAKAALERGATAEDTPLLVSAEAKLVATIEMAKRDEWLPSTEAAMRLQMEATTPCGGSAKICQP